MLEGHDLQAFQSIYPVEHESSRCYSPATALSGEQGRHGCQGDEDPQDGEAITKNGGPGLPGKILGGRSPSADWPGRERVFQRLIATGNSACGVDGGIAVAAALLDSNSRLASSTSDAALLFAMTLAR